MEAIHRADTKQLWLRRIGVRTSNRNLAVFVHGWGGGYVSAWGKMPDLLKAHSGSDRVLRRWDFLFIGYTTWGPFGVRSYTDIARLISTQWKNAESGKGLFNGTRYNRVAFVGHSLGTLGLRKMLSDKQLRPNPDPLAMISSLGFYATPMNGSYLAYLACFVSRTGRSLIPNGTKINALRNQVSRAFLANPWPLVALLLSHADAVVVNEPGSNRSAVSWSGDSPNAQSTNRGHLAMCKPLRWDDEAIDFLRDVLR